jgi:hypothetical protein
MARKASWLETDSCEADAARSRAPAAAIRLEVAPKSSTVCWTLSNASVLDSGRERR